MTQYVEFSYETLNGDEIEVHGSLNGQKVKFVTYTSQNKPFAKSKLSMFDVRNIEEFILENADETMHLNDLDYRND